MPEIYSIYPEKLYKHSVITFKKHAFNMSNTKIVLVLRKHLNILVQTTFLHVTPPLAQILQICQKQQWALYFLVF